MITTHVNFTYVYWRLVRAYWGAEGIGLSAFSSVYHAFFSYCDKSHKIYFNICINSK